MSISINASQIYSMGNFQPKENKSRSAAPLKQEVKAGHVTVRSLEREQRSSTGNTIIDQSKAYAESLKASRTKAKENTLEKKKLQYSYKKISSQIVRSKTSTSARKAASAARREMLRLKRLKASGEYDEEELQISIEHAKSMERVAKKKAAHLQQEEMIERSHGGTMGSIEEKEEEESADEKDSEDMEEALSEEELRALENNDQAYAGEELYVQMTDIQEEMAYHMEELAAELQAQIAEVQENTTDSLNDMMADLSKEMMESMEEMAEELDLTELADTLVAPDPNMSEDDLKMLKLKHRTKEMKEIAKADGDYLKAIFDKYDKKGVAGMSGSSGVSGAAAIAGGGSTSISSAPTPITVTVPAAYGGGAAGGSFDAFA